MSGVSDKDTMTESSLIRAADTAKHISKITVISSGRS